MNPLEYIEDGIHNGNWKTVCKGFEQLTGKKLLSLTESGITKETIKTLSQIVEIASLAINKLRNGDQSVSVKLQKTSQKKRGRPAKKSTTTKIASIDEGNATFILNDQINTPITQQAGGIQLITNKPDPEEVERNKAKAVSAQSNKLKLNRTPVCTFDVKCNECEEVFQSDRQDGELGQKCSKCLKEKKNRLT